VQRIPTKKTETNLTTPDNLVDTATPPKGTTYVLVHGAWHGGWCWNAVARILRADGHQVFTPTLTGLGERMHLLSKDIDLGVFIQDVVNVLEYEDLTNVVLVGHSFGGLPITGAADRVPQRIRQLVFLDAVVLEHGQTAFSRLAPEIVARRIAQSIETSGGLSIPVPPASAFGVFEPAQVALLQRNCTPHPLKTFDDAMVLRGPVGGEIPKVYIQCTDPVYEPMQASRHFVRAQEGWAWDEIKTGHDAMISAPEALAAKLLRYAG
jgi:pimeloyl-ACP methyl ester carboxylesterase